MNFLNIPIKDFYRHCLASAKSAGFKWVVSLVAYDAERDGLYRNLHRAWLSLDSITGKHILFVVAGKENRTHDERWQSRIGNLSDYSVYYNNHVHILNQDIELTDYFVDYRRYSSKDERDVTFDHIRKNQTWAVEELKAYFGISESDLPCLVFISMRNNEKNIIPINKGANDIFSYFKNLFCQIEPRLRLLTELDSDRKSLASKQYSVSAAIKSITFSGNEVIFRLYEELNKQAGDTDNDELLRCIKNKTYGKFEQPLRSKLNRFIDLTKNFEKKNNKSFDPLSAAESCSAKIDKRLALENDLVEYSEKIEQTEILCKNCLDEIDEIIRGSKMSGQTNDRNRTFVNVPGNKNQVIVASGDVTATYSNSIGWNELSELIQSVKNVIPADISSEDSEALSENLDVISEEIKSQNPRKCFLKTALKGLSAIKGTTQFAAAVAALIRFVQDLI
jgi:hypothetical protein